jgi:hypothetical protein
MASRGFGEEHEEAPREAENIFRPFPQWRQLQVNNVETVKQILPKETVSHMILQITVGGGHGPNIGVPGFVLANAFEFLVFEEAQHLCLQGWSDLADLIEKERAPFCGFDAPGLIAHGTCERSFGVTE